MALTAVIARGHPRLDYPSLVKFIYCRALLAQPGLRRPYSSDRKAPDGLGQPSPSQAAGAPLASQGSRSRRVRWHVLRPVFFTAACLLTGLVSGQLLSAAVLPPPLPEPGTELDGLRLAKARKRVGELPLVKELRTRRDEWLEYDAYMPMNPDVAAKSLTAGLLQGGRAISVQRVFWNRAERRLISVVFMGGAMAGWPGVLHGGVTATILQENLERVAGGPEVGASLRQDYRLQDFTIKYRKPANADQIYIVRAELDQGAKDDRQHPSMVKVKATLETATDGTVVTEALGACYKHDVYGMNQVRQGGSSVWGSAQAAVSRLLTW